MKTTFLVLTLLLPALANAANPHATNITGPTGSIAFGKAVTILPNGNLVISDPNFNDGPTGTVGAVHLYTATGTLISTLHGSTANDQVGNGGITVLTTGDFVVSSTNWANVTVGAAGAVTFGNATAGFGSASVAVSAANSLVGSTINDRVGDGGITALKNGNYVVRSSNWDNPSPARVDVGAVTWCPASGARVGTISSANSIIGGTASDRVGDQPVLALSSGNYLVRSTLWDNTSPVAADAGAVTFGNGSSGTAGLITLGNSLVGTSASDQVGGLTVSLLKNGNYVVVSPNWNNLSPAKADVGAVTFGNGTSGVTGVITSANSLIGGTASDFVGSPGLLVLADGNYAVFSSQWDNPAPLIVNVGAVTWCSGSSGRVGVVSSANSLIGTQGSDSVGGNGGLALTNGSYVVFSASWHNGSFVSAGAATWRPAGTPAAATVSTANSIVGGRSSNKVGLNGGRALTNGNFVVISPEWDNGTTTDVGAVTWGNGTTGTVCTVSASNSLIGSTFNDRVGSPDVVALTNGNYVVTCTSWDNGAATNVGAVTWGNGNTGMSGVVSAANSLVGSTSADFAGISGVTALANGNYAVATSTWDNGAAIDAGAVTFGNGTTGVSGAISAANSLVGTKNDDGVGNIAPFALPNGNYVVRSGVWGNPSPAALQVGAVTLGNGYTGIVGAVSATNSLIGTTLADFLGTGLTVFSNSSFAFRTTNWDNPSPVLADCGEVTLCDGTTPVVGVINDTNSILGTVANGSSGMNFAYDTVRELFAVGKPAENIVTLLNKAAGKVTFDDKTVTVNETVGTLGVTVRRVGGSEGTITVNLSTSSAGGTATAGSDYTAITNQVVTFGPGVTEQNILVNITADAVANEANETFKLTLNGGTALLGAIPSTVIRIVDIPLETTVPSAPVVTFPAANARVPVAPGGTITVTGTAKDNRGIDIVTVNLNGEGAKDATLTTISGATANWSITLTPRGGVNTLVVDCLDTASLSPATRTTVTFVVTRPLVVKALGGTATLTAGFSPSSFREVGKLTTVAVTPAAGFLFKNWSISGGATAGDIGVTTDQLELPSLSFVFREGLQLTANIAVSPYTNTVLIGTFNGQIQAHPEQPDRSPPGLGPEDGTPSNNSTEGGITLTLLNNSSFTGRLNIDGLSLPISGNFDAAGIARFGTLRSTTLVVPRTGKTSLALSLTLNLTVGASPALQGILSDVGVNGPTAVSTVEAERSAFNGTTSLVKSALLGPNNSNGSYTAIFPALPLVDQPAGTALTDYPQGDGIANITLTKAGAITVSATLADGTVFTQAGTLGPTGRSQIFVPLYSKRGFLTGPLQFDETQTASDVVGSFLWNRPILDDQHYPDGWTKNISVDLRGCLFAAPIGSSILPNLGALDANGNADLLFTLLTEASNVSFTHGVSIPTNDAGIKPAPVDTTVSLAITRTNGRFSGFFNHPDGTKPTYQGIVLRKGSTPTASGFFKTVSPKAKDYTGQAGRVSLTPQ